MDDLLKEAVIGASLSHHSSFVLQHGVVMGSWNGQTCIRAIVMEHMFGGNLHDALR